MHLLRLVFTFALVVPLAGCEVIGTIFEVGMWFGIILALAIAGAAVWIVSKFRK